MSFTKGPWELGTHPANPHLNIIKPVMFGSQVTVLPECEGGHVSIDNIANARLIAAAPDLLEALDDLILNIGKSPTGRGLFSVEEAYSLEFNKARSAISKARGES